MVHIVKQKKKSIKFNVVRESRLIENLIEKLPDDDTVYKIVSFGGFSSIGFVNYIAAQTKIKKNGSVHAQSWEKAFESA